MNDLDNNHKSFFIHHDKTEKKETERNVNSISNQVSEKLSLGDKENIVNAWGLDLKQERKTKNLRNNVVKNKSEKLLPLYDLDIYKYPGYINFGFNHEKKDFFTSKNIQLFDRYEPSNYKNDFNSNHKYLDIPSYLTPTKRNKKNSYLYRSRICFDKRSTSKYDNHKLLNLPVLNKHVNPDLSEKSTPDFSSIKLDSRQTFSGRKRSFSLGRNNSKMDLIKKNNFVILGN